MFCPLIAGFSDDPLEVGQYLALGQETDARSFLGPLSLVLGLEVLRRVVVGLGPRHAIEGS
jgi:hypothetical protein